MRRFVQSLLGAAVLLTGVATLAPAPASAQGYSIEVGPGGVEINRDRGRYDERERWDRDRWDRDDRRRWDRDRRSDRRWDGPGRISRESVARCAQRYRSYDPRTHTYVVNRRGDRAVCRL